MENKEKKEAKVQAQWGQVVRRSPRTIDIRKFYKKSSSSGEEKKVEVGTVSLEFRLFPLCCSLCFNSQRIEQENAKQEADQKEKENIKKEAVMKHRKVKAAIKRKQVKNVAKKIKSNPKL